MEHLYARWVLAKQAEREAVEYRRQVEDQIVAACRIPESLEGVSNQESAAYTVKITGRLERKIDADKLQELAAEAGLTDHLSSLFRWKPEINMKNWKQATDNITLTPGRPSISITLKD